MLLLSRSIAFAAPVCSMPDNHQSSDIVQFEAVDNQTNHHMMMGHGDMIMSDTSSESGSLTTHPDDCCDEDCSDCVMASCGHNISYITQVTDLLSTLGNGKFAEQKPIYLSHFPSFLFKPPILSLG
ncbi:MAG: hypothetical protein OEY19_08560 [Gammaproteobacteria bacterium]|nr:hypothetical protein [Gammaproteobacteria bacterium]MDH5629309.1 hypothetical protein [Gammaproteobacteria bacterium]